MATPSTSNHSMASSNVTLRPLGDTRMDINWDDATWILTSSFIIFTMQSGFGLLESGMVSTKNEVNIMVKNCVDVIFGGLTFWSVGFGLAFGDGPYSNRFCGVGYFFLNVDDSEMGLVFSWFIFQMSFATTSTTVVAGAMAERVKLTSYIVFSAFNILVYCFPAHWIWSKGGFLRQLGVIDIAGAGAVHLVGGFSALVATLMLKPRTGRFDGKHRLEMGCPTNSLVGLFMLWWGWLGFNCGSTFGVSNGKWKLAARSAVATLCASTAGGVVCCGWSWLVNKRKFLVPDIIYGVLGSLVSITGICALARPWESLVIGGIGGLLAVSTPCLMNKLKIDDPVGIFAVHGVCGVWAMISIGLFTHQDDIQNLTYGNKGLFPGGGFHLLGLQTLGVLVIGVWSIVGSYCLLKAIDCTIGLRVSAEEERLGSDWVEHGIRTEESLKDVSSSDIHQRLFHRRQSLGLRHHSSFSHDLPIEAVENNSPPQRRKSQPRVSFAREISVCSNAVEDSPKHATSSSSPEVINETSSMCDSGVSSDEEKVQIQNITKRRRISKSEKIENT